MPKFNLAPVTDMLQKLYASIWNLIYQLPRIGEETLGWLAVVILHSATLPSMLAYSQGLTNDYLPIDMVLLLWTGLMLLFIKAVIRKDMLNVITIGAGFAVQAGILALTLFK
jgi:hypothetical protein